MNQISAGLKVSTLGMLALPILAGCGSIGAVNTTPATRQAPVSATTPAAQDSSTDQASSSAPATRDAHVGDTLTLKGNTDGEQLDVTLVRVAVRPAATEPDVDTPKAGDRYYAAQFKIVNTGTASYEDAPDNGTKVGDAQGEQFDSTITEGINAGPLLPTQLKLAPDGTVLGWMVFEVPNATPITQVQFSTDSGFGATGQWIVP